MASVQADEQANAIGEKAPQAYGPGWVDHLTARVAGLPGPSWSYYLGLGLILLCVQGVVLWIEGALPFPTVDRAHVFLAVVIPYILALIHYLDGRAGVALAGMRPALKLTEDEYDDMSYRLTTLPAGPTLLAGLVALACPFLTEALVQGPYNLPALQAFSISANLFRFIYLLCWWVFGTFVFHTFHQLRLINRIYTKHTRINLFGTKSLYAFSNLTALTAGSLAVIPYGFLFVNLAVELIQEDPVIFSIYLIITSFAVVTFIWPQLGIHRIQVAEKERLLDEANQRFEATITSLHQRIDSGKLEKIGELSTVMGSLETEKRAVNGISTWPWEPEVVRVLITALALPLGLWLVQYVLQRFLAS